MKLKVEEEYLEWAHMHARDISTHAHPPPPYPIHDNLKPRISLFQFINIQQ